MSEKSSSPQSAVFFRPGAGVAGLRLFPRQPTRSGRKAPQSNFIHPPVRSYDRDRQAQKRETHGKNCIQVMSKVRRTSHRHPTRMTALPAPTPASSQGTVPMRSIVEIPDPIPYDPQQVPQLIPADPEIEPDTRVPELLKSAA